MITCNRCGTNNPAGTIHCQRCGILLTQMGANGGNQEQPALPAWLESLRSGMGDAGSDGNRGSTPFTSENQSDSDFGEPNNNRSNHSGQLGGSDNSRNQAQQESPPPIFHASDLIDDNALPSWLRSIGEKGASAQAPINKAETPTPQTPQAPQAPHTLRPASYAAPNTDESFFTDQENINRGIAANSLVDEQALPPWMRQNQEAAPQDGQHPIPASSLIQADAMPDWMKNIQAPPAYSESSTAASAFPQQKPGMPPSTDPFQAQQAAGQNLSARDLIDAQSLPNWMKQQDGQSGQSGPLPASSLIDQGALPQWMREESQRPNAAPPYTQAPQSQQAPQTAPTNPAGWQGNSGQMPSSPQHTIAASSFIDMNALPPWLRQNEGGQSPLPQGTNQAGQGGQMGQQRPAYPVPPRGENMRVPSRPRSEMTANEGSEVAANVFASMLGVASTTPNFPPAPQGYPGQQGAQGGVPTLQPMGNPQQAMPPYGNMGNMPPQQQQAPQGYNMQGAGAYPGGNGGMQGSGNSPMGAPPTPGMYPNGNYPMGNSPSGTYPAGNYPMGNSPMMSPPHQQPGMQNYGSNQYPPNAANMGNQARSAMRNEQSPNQKPAKRSLFEAIRSWLSRS